MRNVLDFLDRFAPLLSILGIGIIAFLFGAAVVHYRLPTSQSLENGFTAATAWYEAFNQAPVTDQPITLDTQENKISGSQTTWQDGKTFGDYTLISLRFSTSVFLIDMRGNVVYQWNMPFKKAWPNPPHIHSLIRTRIFINKAHVFPNGDVLAQYTGINDTPYGYGLLKMDKHSKVLWTYDDNSHHDFYVDEKGYIYALTQSVIEGNDKQSVLTDYVVTLTPDGKEINRISIFEAIKNSPYQDILNIKKKDIKNGSWDHIHANAVMPLEESMAKHFPLFKAGDVLIGSRALNAVVVINPITKQAKWIAKGSWRWPHAAIFLPNGRIALMDNRGMHSKTNRESRVIEFDPNSLTITWDTSQFPSVHFSTNIYGRIQRLANKNTLIAATMSSRIFEITQDGSVVWDYTITDANGRAKEGYNIATAHRYTKDELPFLNQTSRPDKKAMDVRENEK